MPEADISPTVQGVRAKCIQHLATPDKLHPLAHELATLATNAVHSNDMPTAADAMQALFDLACSGSGTVVWSNSHDPTATDPVAVLILGFAGSSVPVLEPLATWYASKYPKWRIVLSTGSGFSTDPMADTHLTAQLDAIVQALAGCKKVLVHACSNNGHGLFAALLHRKRDVLRSRIAAVLYDCCVSMEVGRAAKWEMGLAGDELIRFHTHVVLSTVWM